ncbi:hypothetical protein ACFOSC_00860 [Streptantibioticus rubrisoli]|uniref:Uncharacterized protein n=1 Tax=Streptantibioticus rubrisoli TaxID=1387313 RepID=A0ABT1PGH9_9ACTN|nr:hypothetical protein [Streptantibioticus rubrisoli]MCQ4043318.1 hypothetical protein [Streptantibioticus rubrisoli]
MDGIVEEQWSVFLRHWDVSRDQEVALAEMVTAEPDRHDWRVVDAAFDRLVCSECGDRLSRGPVACSACDLAHGFRYAAIETDRPGVRLGNEHAIRVNVSVVRRPQVTSDNEVLVRRLLLPVLLVGHLPSIEEAQRMSALVKRSPQAQKHILIEQAIEEIARHQRRAKRRSSK